MKWSYGVTTVERRKKDLLPHTLASLKAAGFDRPRLFVDGTRDIAGWEAEFGLDVTARTTPLFTAGNWCLALAELYIREPWQDRYAVFQDDFVTYPNLRQYLERTPYPERGYCNLYTFPSNQKLCPRDASGTEQVGWFLSNQLGRGAVALVFSRPAVLELLSSRHLVERPQDVARGKRSIDGGIVTAFVKAGWREYTHHPSLVQHLGAVSSMGNKPHLQAVSFRGEDFDATNLLREVTC